MSIRTPFLLTLIFAGIGIIPAIAIAQQAGQFVPLVPDFPQIKVNSYNLPNLLNAFYGVAVGIAGLLAVIMVSIGGFKYMLSESVFSKSDAKEQITDALIGLGIVLAAVVLLKVINPDLINLDILRKMRASPPQIIVPAAPNAPAAPAAAALAVPPSIFTAPANCTTDATGAPRCTCPVITCPCSVKLQGETCTYTRQ